METEACPADEGPAEQRLAARWADVADLLGLAPRHADALVRVIEASPQVQRRHQFFVWTQGPLQALLPHQLAVCGSYQRQRRALDYEVFHSVVLPERALALLTDARGPLLDSLTAAWSAGRGRPLALDLDPSADAVAHAVLRDCGITQLLVHGVARPQRPAEIESLFVFATPGRRCDAAQRLHLDLLIPNLHAVWQRVQGHERTLATRRPAPAPGAGADGALTPRERQILAGLCEGLSNQQVGARLGISPLTVKNHVQQILRKLGVANRTQAAAHALSLQGLGADREAAR